jgi:Flp pilus assembly protein CpaB
VLLRALAIGLALFTARLVAVDLATLHRRAATLGPLVPVVEARRAVPLGTVLEPADLRVVERHESAVAPTTLSSLDDAIGRTARVEIVAGSPVLTAQLVRGGRASTAALVAPERRAVRVVTIDGLRPPVGAIVEVYASVDTTTTVVARGARVLAVDGGSDGAETGVLVEVRASEALDLAFAAANGALVLALAPPEDACCEEEASGSGGP